MFRNIGQSDLTFVEAMLGRINRSVRNLFQKANVEGFLANAYIYEECNCQGVFTIIEGDSYYSVQLSFEPDLTNGADLFFLEDSIKKIIQTKGKKELYFNVNAYNVIFIAPEFQANAYGLTLMDFCIHNRFCEHQFKELYLYICDQNRNAQRFYVKKGFKVKGYYYETTYIYQGGKNEKKIVPFSFYTTCNHTSDPVRKAVSRT